MKYYDYSDIPAFLYDKELISLLCADRSYSELRGRFLFDDFLIMDPEFKVPFFAEVRDYVGACERDSPQVRWIVKEISKDDSLGPAMGSICFFLDFFTKSVSAPSVVTRIGGRFFKATKIMTKAEQLSGANYTEVPRLKEQLLLDLVNRWIYCDEDRNPNNYMVHYTSRGDPVVIAIDFSNVDLLFPGTKIKGRAKSFGWERMEKTRYLTPLKAEHFYGYDMQFFGMRFKMFAKVGRKMLLELCKECLRFQPDRAVLARTATDNILKRITYVRDYFSSQFPKVVNPPEKEKYQDMGKTFTSIYKEK
jgi:hypothetical protein